MLDDIKKTLWAAADKLSAVGAAECKHVMRGLIFLKCVFDTFTARRAVVIARLRQALVRPPALDGTPHFWFHRFIASPFQRLLESDEALA